MNFENADGLEFDLSEEDINAGVRLESYPIFNDIYASPNAMSYAEYLRSQTNASVQMSKLDAHQASR